MGIPDSIGKLFCDDGRALFVGHVKSCKKCQSSIVTLLDMFPFFTMGKKITQKDFDKFFNEATDGKD